jgi:hypothetical protein
MVSKASGSLSSGSFQATMAHAPDGSGGEHDTDALDDGIHGDAGAGRDFGEGLADETLYLVLGNREDAGVQGVVVFDRGHL